jgi:hypothetical protein
MIEYREVMEYVVPAILGGTIIGLVLKDYLSNRKNKKQNSSKFIEEYGKVFERDQFHLNFPSGKMPTEEMEPRIPSKEETEKFMKVHKEVLEKIASDNDFPWWAKPAI